MLDPGFGPPFAIPSQPTMVLRTDTIALAISGVSKGRQPDEFAVLEYLQHPKRIRPITGERVPFQRQVGARPGPAHKTAKCNGIEVIDEKRQYTFEQRAPDRWLDDLPAQCAECHDVGIGNGGRGF